MTNHSGEWNIYLRNPATHDLAVVHSWEALIEMNNKGYVKIGRAQWRQLKREQKRINDERKAQVNMNKVIADHAKESPFT